MRIIINGKQIEVDNRKTILETARENNIYIPSLCDHSGLIPFSGCRLCIVKIKGRKGYAPSCSTYVEEGMEIKTESPQIGKMRRQILDLILSEHPNACLICNEKENCDEYKATIRKVIEVTGCVLCPNNGRCELQDIVEYLKVDKVSFPSVYRDFEVKKNDPFFDRNYNLCILCGRCVRVCHEVRGISAISFVNRGPQTVIGTPLDRPLLDSECQFCGACVDICPTGALTERAIKYEHLPSNKVKTICPVCSMGCELEVELKDERILSFSPSDDGPVNHGQACVRGRFTLKDIVYSPRRIVRPLIRKNKKLEEVSWQEALDFVVQGLKNYRGKEIVLTASLQATCEDSYILRKFARDVLKTENIVSTAYFSPLGVYRDLAKKKGFEPYLNFKIEDISKAKVIFLLGEDITVSNPIIWLKVFEAVKEGAKLIVASPTPFSLNRFSSLWLRIKPGSEYYLLSFLSKVLLDRGQIETYSHFENFDSFEGSLDNLRISQVKDLTGISLEDFKKTALFLNEKPAVFLFGSAFTQSEWSDQNVSALWNLSLQNSAHLIPTGLESNSRGFLELARPSSGEEMGMSQITQGVTERKIKSIYSLGPVPYLEEKKPEFFVIQDSFMNENMRMADAILPAATFAEVEGTFVNTEGRIQKFEKVIDSLGDAKPDWWIISQLARGMSHEGFDYKTSSEIMEEIQKFVHAFSKVSYTGLKKGKEIFLREDANGKKKFIPIKFVQKTIQTDKKYPFLLIQDYSLDYYRSCSLSQESKGFALIRNSRWIRMNPEDAARLELKSGGAVVVESSLGKTRGYVKVFESIPAGTVVANFLLNESKPFSMMSSAGLGALPVRIKRGK